ncbi:14312_t:CDS:1 [Funneliformis geosporum]|uniref:14312_t:CDS:1 n=1 Tax=Funneliformis geosporum TaxID=1117311 RepID=A0A9W4WWD5_9GLOM|nr:14312_t:CDS:1 [Funneliformis geosporum]
MILYNYLWLDIGIYKIAIEAIAAVLFFDCSLSEIHHLHCFQGFLKTSLSKVQTAPFQIGSSEVELKDLGGRLLRGLVRPLSIITPKRSLLSTANMFLATKEKMYTFSLYTFTSSNVQ